MNIQKTHSHTRYLSIEIDSSNYIALFIKCVQTYTPIQKKKKTQIKPQIHRKYTYIALIDFVRIQLITKFAEQTIVM